MNFPSQRRNPVKMRGYLERGVLWCGIIGFLHLTQRTGNVSQEYQLQWRRINQPNHQNTQTIVGLSKLLVQAPQATGNVKLRFKLHPACTSTGSATAAVTSQWCKKVPHNIAGVKFQCFLLEVCLCSLCISVVFLQFMTVGQLKPLSV